MTTTKPATQPGIEAGNSAVAPGAGGERRSGIVGGQVLCVLGLISAVMGAFGLEVSFEAVGIVLGTLGYALGASRLGSFTVVLSTIMLLFLLAVGQGYVPGPWPMDPLAL